MKHLSIHAPFVISEFDNGAQVIHEPCESREIFCGNTKKNRVPKNNERLGLMAFDCYGHPIPDMVPIFSKDKNWKFIP